MAARRSSASEATLTPPARAARRSRAADWVRRYCSSSSPLLPLLLLLIEHGPQIFFLSPSMGLQAFFSILGPQLFFPSSARSLALSSSSLLHPFFFPSSSSARLAGLLLDRDPWPSALLPCFFCSSSLLHPFIFFCSSRRFSSRSRSRGTLAPPPLPAPMGPSACLSATRGARPRARGSHWGWWPCFMTAGACRLDPGRWSRSTRGLFQRPRPRSISARLGRTSRSRPLRLSLRRVIAG